MQDRGLGPSIVDQNQMNASHCMYVTFQVAVTIMAGNLERIFYQDSCW
jgi:hypothetical protein